MRGSFFAVLLATASAGIALPAAGQTLAPRPRTHVTPQTQAQVPFTAEFRITNVKTLANGNTITHERTEMQAVDAQGRKMTATTTVDAGGQERTSTIVFDPVAGTRTNWSAPGERATVMSTHPAAPATPCAPRPPAPNTQSRERPTSTSEDLGTEEIQGVEAHGIRVTTITPAGMVGNSEPLMKTHEAWTVLSIRPNTLVVREVDDNPEAGKTTREATSLTLSEPEESAFQPPQGYEIVTKDPPQAACPATVAPAAPAQPAQ
jgi:hypothetical protein